jgi:hypothetical protein
LIATESKLRLVAVVVDTQAKRTARVEVAAFTHPPILDGKALALQPSDEEIMDLQLGELRNGRQLAVYHYSDEALGVIEDEIIGQD